MEQHKDGEHNRVIYECYQCGYLATSNKKLRQHEGMRYPCPKCDYIACLASDLNRHRTTAHDEITYPCDLCRYVATENVLLLGTKELCTNGSYIHVPSVDFQ